MKSRGRYDSSTAEEITAEANTFTIFFFLLLLNKAQGKNFMMWKIIINVMYFISNCLSGNSTLLVLYN